jgi:hypothetical protein
MLLVSLRNLMSRTATVTLGVEGAHISLPGSSMRFVAWGDMERVSILHARHADLVQIHLKTAATAPQLQVISIPTAAIDITAAELAGKIQKRLGALQQ